MEQDTEIISDSTPNLLDEYENNEISLIKLAKTLLSSATLPHIILVTTLSIVLYIMSSVDSLIETVAIIFLSLSIGYAITALFSKNETIKNWITLDQESTSSSNFVKRNILKFRICALPLSISLMSFFVLYLCFSDDGLIPIGLEFFPLALGSLFVVWSIVQGTSFTQWASSNSAKNSRTTRMNQNLRTSVINGGLIITICAMIVAALFYKINNFDKGILDVLIASLPFSFIAIAVYAANITYTWKIKTLASMKSKLHFFSHRWSLICHMFVTWHLLTIWRQNFMGTNKVQLYMEEISLMIFTVFIAIWSMTAKGYKSKLKLINEENALSWGLAFGYAYAGSVAMLTNVFDDISIVMQIGHGVVILTVLVIHKKVLVSVIGKDDIEIEVKRILANDNELNSESSITEENEYESDEEVDEAWQEDDDVDWSVPPNSAIIEDVEWEEVIEVD